MRDRDRSFEVAEQDSSLVPEQDAVANAAQAWPEHDVAIDDEQIVDADSLWQDEEGQATDAASPPADPVAPHAQRPERPQPTRLRRPTTWRERLLSPSLTGTAAAACVILGSGGSVLAMVALSGWRPASLTTLQMLALACAGLAVLALAVIAFRAAQSVAEEHRARWTHARGLLGKLVALDPDGGAGWDDPALRRESDLARFLDTLRFRDQRQRELIDRLATLEREAAQLGSRLLERDRTAVTEAYGQAMVSRIATGVSLLYEELDKQQRDQAVASARVVELGGQVSEFVREARGWHDATHDRLNVQIVALQRLGEEVQKLAASVDEKVQALQEDQSRQLPTARVVAQTLTGAPATGSAGDLARTAQLCKDLMARGGSLAIQAALEVTRLGERGEALFPLTEQLKQLVTDFQRLATQLEEASQQHAQMRATTARALAMVEQIAAAQERDISELEAYRRIGARLSEQKLALVRLSADLDSLVQSFNDQSARLETAAGTLGELTGERPLSAHEGQESAGAGLTGPAFVVENFGGMQIGGDRQAPPLIPSSCPSEQSHSTTIATEAPPARPLEPLGLGEGASLSDLPLVSTVEGVAAEVDERIYDLAELGAVVVGSGQETPVGSAVAGAAEQERIYDLSEFGAVALA